MKIKLHKLHILLIFLFVCFTLKAQQSSANQFNQVVMNPSTNEKFLKLQGSMTYVGNSVVKRQSRSSTELNNSNIYLEYINIDPSGVADGGGSIYNSSSASLAIPSCAKIKYVGLYWTGLYPSDDYTTTGTKTQNWKQIQFKMPGQTSYTAIENDKVLLGIDHSLYANKIENHYVCYADITSKVNALSNSNGSYFGANIASGMDSVKSTSLGTAAGWSMVVIYEDLQAGLSRYFTVFHGHADIRNSNAQPYRDVVIDGFKTIPPQSNGTKVPVKVDLLIAALEGDQGILNDTFRVLRDDYEQYYPSGLVTGNFRKLKSTNNSSVDNFFDSTLTLGNQYLQDSQAPPLNAMNPEVSKNSMGIDAHMFRMANDNNKYVTNNDTKAIFRFDTTGDTYFPFLMVFSVEIIKPVITITNTVHLGGAKFGADNLNANNLSADFLTPAGVAPKIKLGDEFFYDLCFENHSTESAVNIKITDQLPFGVSLLLDNANTAAVMPININGVPNSTQKFNIDYSSADITWDTSSGATVDSNKVKFLNYTPPTATDGAILEFLLGDDLGDNKYIGKPKCLRLKVMLDDDCTKFTSMTSTSCSGTAGNHILADYTGPETGSVTVGQSSYNTYDICGPPSDTNFLIDRGDCISDPDKYVKTLVCVGTATTLTAGTGFGAYKWFKKDVNGNWAVISGQVSNTLSISGLNTSLGDYKVEKTAPTAVACGDGTEIFRVLEFSSAPNPFKGVPVVPATNPVTYVVDPLEEGETVCSDQNSSAISEFYLCGNDKTGSGKKTIILPYDATITITWEKLTNTADPTLIADQNITCASITPPSGWAWTALPVSNGNVTGPIGSVDSKKFIMTTAGDYRVKTDLSGICDKYYYFRVFNADFEPGYSKLDKLCSNKGYIEVIDLSGDIYQTKLQKRKDPVTSPVVWETVAGYDWTDVPAGASTKGFNIIDTATYRYQVRLKDPKQRTCPYISDPIAIDDKNFTVGIAKGNVTCSLVTGSVVYTANVKVSPDALETTTSYVYELYEAATTAGLPANGTWVTDTSLPTPTTGKIDTRIKTYTGSPFEDWSVTPGKKYKVVVTATTTKYNVTKKCRKVETFDFAVPQALTLTATRIKNISCTNGSNPGIVKITVSGGPASPVYTYERALVTNPGPTETVGSYFAANLTDEIVYDASLTYPVTYRYRASVNSNNYCSVTKDVVVGLDPPFTFNVTTEGATCSVVKGKVNIELTLPTSTSDMFQYELINSSNATVVSYNTPPVAYVSTKTFSVAPDTYTVNIRVWKDLALYNSYKSSPSAILNKYSCTYTYTNKIVPAAVALTDGTVAKTDVGCTAKGTITFTQPTTGTASFTYSVIKTGTTNLIAASAADPLKFTNLDHGTYEVKIIDSKSCEKTFPNIIIADKPTEPTFTVSSPTYDCDGKGSFKVTPVATGYTYELKNSSGAVIATSPSTANPVRGTFTDIAPDVNNYNVVVSYGMGCLTSATIPVTITSGNGITASITLPKAVTCFNAKDGKGTLTVTNFDTTFWYRNISDSSVTSATASNTSPVALTGIPGGSNIFEVYYKNPIPANVATQCKTSVTVVIPTSTVLLSIANITPPTLPCVVGTTTPTGTIIPIASGGTIPYVYAIANASPTPTSTSWVAMTGTSFSKPAGTYIIRVTDKNNCVKKTAPFTINSSAAPIFTLSEVACPNRYGNDADIKVTLPLNVTPATAGYEYQISTNNTSNSSGWIGLPTFNTSNPSTTEITSGSVVNNNFVHIRAKGPNTCEAKQSLVIKDTLSFSATTTPPSFCNLKQAEILISSENGGAGNYEFALVKTTITPTVPALTAYNALTNSKILVPVADIAVGATQSFDVYMKDSNNCTTKRTYNITRPSPVVVVIAKSYTPCSTVSPKIKITTLKDGNGPYTVKAYEVSAPTTSIGTLTSVPVIAGGSPIFTFTGTINKEYFVIATDKDGCPITSNKIKFDQSAVLNATLGTIIQPVCPADKGIININKPTPSAALTEYVYTLINTTGSTPVNLTPVTSSAAVVPLTVPSEGTYKINISPKSINSTSGCPQTLGPVTIKALLDPLPTYKTPTISYDCDGKATIKVYLKAGVTIPTGVQLTYVLDNFVATNTNTDHHGEFVVPAGVGTYNITVVYARTGQAVTAPIGTINARTPCTNVITVTTQNVKFAAAIDSFTNVKCNNTATGTITFSATNYGTSFFYKYLKPLTSNWVDGTSTTATETISNLPAGITKIKVYRTAAERTADYCGKEISQKILNPTVLGITIKVRPMQCDNPKEAKLTATATGGWGTYVYSISDNYVAPTTTGGVPVNAGTWTASTANPATSFKKLVGTYFIKATDTNGCEVISTAQNIVAAKNIVFKLTHTGLKCAPYGIDGDVRIQLLNGDSAQDYQYTIGTGSPIPFNFSPTTITYPNGTIGTINVHDITTGTSVGINSIEILNKDTGCSATKTIVIKEDLTVAVNQINTTSCSKGNFSFSSISGGEAPYTYQVTTVTPAIEPAASTFTDAVPANLVLFRPGTNAGYTFTGTSKIYYIWVKDKNGCIKKVTKTLTKKPDLALTVTRLQKECSGGDPAKLIVTVTGGSANYQVEVFDKLAPTIALFTSNFTNTNLTTVTNLQIDVTTFIPVAGKTFIVKVTDNDNCTKVSADQVMVYGSTAEPTMVITQPLCAGDKGVVTITNPSIDPAVLNHATGPFEYTLTLIATMSGVSITPAVFKGTTTSVNSILTTKIDVVQFGTYEIIVKDIGLSSNSSQCPFAFKDFEVKPKRPMPLFELESLDYICDGTADFKIIPKPSDAVNYASAIADGVHFHYVLRNEPFAPTNNANSSFTSMTNPNTNGEFNVPSLTKNYNVDIYYLNAGQTFDPNNIGNIKCGNIGNVVVKVVKDKEFKAKFKGKTPQVCKGDNNSGTATFDVSNFSLNTTTGNYFYKKGPSISSLGAEISSTDAVLTVTGLPLGKTYFVFAPSVADFTNGLGCKIVIEVDITEPTFLLLPRPTITNITCTQTGYTMATITPLATGGTPNPNGYKYYIKKTTDTTWGTVAAATFTKPVGTDLYEIKVVDSAGCEKISPSFKIEAPETPSFTLTEEDCEYGVNADVKITNTSTTLNTTTQYQYQIVGQSSWTTFTFSATNTYILQTGLNVGLNNVKVRNKTTLCFSQENITILPKLDFTVTNVIPSSCDVGGFKVLTNTGGHPVYTFAVVKSVPGTLPTSGFTALNTAGIVSIPSSIAPAYGASETYIVWMKDSKGCTKKINPITLTRDAKLVVTVAEKQPECLGDKGKLTYTITGGRANYSVQLQITDTSGVTSNVLGVNSLVVSSTGTNVVFDVDPGNYNVEVTDARTCEKTSIKKVINPGKVLNGNVGTPIQPTCFVNTGSITFVAPTLPISANPDYGYYLEECNVDVSTVPYTYTPITSPNVPTVIYSSTATITNIPPGAYYPIIKDKSIANGCPQRFSPIYIKTLPTKVLEFDTVISYDCNAVPTLTITPKAGSKPSDINYFSTPYSYIYTVNGVTSNPTIAPKTSVAGTGVAIVVLPVGDFNYTVDVNNGIDGCLTTSAFTVDVDLDKFKLSKIDVTEVSCYNGNDGKLKVTVAYPNPNIDNTTSPTTPVAGFYYRTSTSGPWIRQTGDFMELTNLGKGAVDVYISYDNLSTAGSCVITVNENIPNVPELKILNVNIITPLACSPTGVYSSAELNVITGGTIIGRTYTYTVLKEGATPGTYTAQSPTGTSSTIYIGDKGKYKIKITDNKGCSTESLPFEIKDPVNVEFSLSKTCFDQTNDGTITIVTGTYGTPTALSGVSFQIKKDAGIFTTVLPNVITTVPPNTTYELANLKPGNYQIKVNDNTNCSTIKNITIDDVITFSAIALDKACNLNASITVKNIVGGNIIDGYSCAFVDPAIGLNSTTTFLPCLNDPVTGVLYALLSVPNLDIPLVGDSKTYDIYVKSNGCISKKISKTVKHIAPVNAVFAANGVNEPTCDDPGSLTIDITGGLQAYTAVLTNLTDPTVLPVSKTVNGTPASTTTPASGTVSFLGLVAADYQILITDSANCTFTLTKTLVAPPPMPKFLGVQTPNNKDCILFDALPQAEKDKYILGGYMDAAYPPTPVNLSNPAYAGYAFEISINGGSSWTSGYEVTGVRPGTAYHVIIRMIIAGTTTEVCKEDLGKGKMPMNVIGLILKATFTGDCSIGFSVLLNVTEGYGPFEFSMDGGLNWVNASEYVLTPVPTVTYMTGHTFSNLVLGQQYKFVVRDKSTLCKKENVGIPNYLIPVKITPETKKDICFDDGPTSTTGEITFKVLNVPGAPGGISTGTAAVPFVWTLYKKTTANPLGVTTGITGNAVLPASAGTSFVTIPNIPGLTIGTYYLKIVVGVSTINPKGCEYASADVKIQLNTEIIAKLEKIRDVTCNNSGLVRIVNVSGGTGPYTYSIVGVNNIVIPTTLAANGLDVLIPMSAVTPGSSTAQLSVFATDVNRCISTNLDNKVSVNVSQNPIISITDSESCTLTNKTITVEVMNKTISPPVYTYEYSLDGVNWTSETLFNASHTISGLSATGTYNVRVIDSSGCYSNIEQVILGDPLDFTLSNDFKSCDVNKNTIKIDNFSGSGNYTWNVVAGVGGTTPLPVPASGTITTNSGTAQLLVNKNSSYAILVKDTSTNCEKTISIQTGEGLKPSFILTSTPTDCYNGSYAVSMDDNNTNLTYSIIVGNTAAGSTGAAYTANSTGDGYTFTTMDNTLTVNQEFIIRGTNSKLCFYDTTVTVEIPAKINLTASATIFKCTSVNTTGKVLITTPAASITGGSSPYIVAKLFKLDSSGGSAYIKSKNLPSGPLSDIIFEIDDLYAAGGDFFVRVYDHKGCYGDSSTFTIDEFDALTSLSYNVLQAENCAGKERIKVNFVSITNDPTKVTVTVTPSGGTAVPVYTPYVVELDSANQPYEIKVVHDTTDCELIIPHTFSQTPRVILSTAPSSVICNGASDGSVVITVANYAGTDYNYDITGGPIAAPISMLGLSSTTPIFTVPGLPAGTYTLTLKLSEYSHKIGSTTDCGEVTTFTIGEPSQAIVIAVTSKTDLTCKDSNDGKLEYIATNGAGGPYEYKVELLSADPSLGPVTVVNVLTGTVVPGTPPTTTAGYGTSTSLSNLLPGFYRITAKDNSGCENINKVVEIENQTDITGTIGNFACSNGIATKVTVTATGGTPGTGYTYELYSTANLTTPITQQSSNEFLISVAGEYSIKVKDVNGCVSSDYMKYNGANTFIIYENLDVELAKETDLITCSDDGLATVKITSGSGNYTYIVTNLQNNTTQTGTINVGYGTTNGAASFTFDTDASSAIVGDNYSVLVTDNVSTCNDTKQFQVAPAITPTFSVTPVALTCSSSEYKVQLSSSTALTYTFMLQTTPSATQFAGVVDVNNILTITKITGVTGVVTENVTVIATDPVTGCSKEEVINVTLLENLISPIVVNAQQFVCAATTNNKNDASITLTSIPSGGAGAPYTAELWEVVGSTENRIDIKSANSNPVFILNNPGTYYIKMYDATNVCFVTSSQEIIAPFEALPAVSVNPVPGTISCDGKEEITLDWSEETPTSPIQVTISATNGSLNTQLFTTPSTAPINLVAGDAPYKITTENTVTGCIIVQTYNLSTAPTPQVYVTATNVDCKGSSTGSVVFDFADTYTGSYTFEVYQTIAGTVTGSAVGTVSSSNSKMTEGLSAGTYKVIVTRSNFPNCISKKDFEIKEPIDPLLVTPVVTDLSCTSTVDGKLSLSSTGGWGTYKYTVEKVSPATVGGIIVVSNPSSYIVDATIQTKSVQTQLSYLVHGFYKVTVFDDNGCSHSDVAEIKQPILVDGSVAIAKIDCSLIDTKVTFVTATGGTPTLVGSSNHYTYGIYNDFDDTLYAGPLTGQQNTISFNINDTGNYYGKITDSKNCTKKLPVFSVYEKLTFEALQEIVATTCDAPGKVRFKISGGKGTYTYTVQGANTLTPSVTTMITAYEGTFETDNNFDNQIYTVTVTDTGVVDASGNPCSISKPITIAPWSTPKFNVAETKPVCASDYYVLATDNSNLVYTASEVIPLGGTAKFGITMTPAGVFHVSKLAGVTNAATGIVRITGAFPISVGSSVGSSACPIDKDITVTFKEDINVPTLTETQFACTAGTNTSNYATIDVAFTAGAAANGPYTASLWKVNSSSGTVLNPSNAITSMTYVNAATTFQVTDYTGGTYEVRMFDGTNVCSSNATVVINPFVELKAPSIQSVANTISCNGTEEVNITWVKTSTGVQLDIVPGPGSGSGSLTAASTDIGGVLNAPVITTVILRAGDKVVLNNMTTGCKLTKVYTPTPKPYYTITVDKKDVCIGGNDGEATFSFVGTPTYDISNTANTYTYVVFNEVGGVQTGSALGSTVNVSTITGLPKGNYIAVVTMTAFPNCEVTKLFKIEEPQPLAFLTANGETKANHVLCNGDSNGSIEFIADGGWGSYEYEVTTPAGVTLSSTTTPAYNRIDTFITGLGVGIYTVRAIDKNVCDVITTLEIKDPIVITADPLVIVDNCDVATAAKVTVPNATGGLVSPGLIDPNGYKFVLYTLAGTIYAGPQSTNEFNIADSGTYQIRVFNDKGCSSDFIKFGLANQFTINDKLKFKLSETKSVTCNADGEVTINVTSGSGTAPSLANYTIEVKDPAATPPLFVALPSGTNTFATDFNNNGLVYTVRVTDNNSNNGCSLDKDITVSDPALPYFTATEIVSDCFGSPYVAVLSNPNLVYTYTTTLTANVNGAVVTGATNSSMINNRIEVGQVNTSNAALSGTITITGTDATTGCSINVPLTINIPAKVNVITKPAIQFNCAVSTPANNTVESAKVQAGIAPADVASFSQAVLYKVGAGGSPDIFMDIKPITSVDISFDVTDYAGGDYYISLYKGSCATNTGNVTIQPFAPLNSYTLQVIDATDCAGMETIQITPATGTTITVNDNTGNSVPLVTGTIDQYIVQDDTTKYPYSVTVSNGTNCELVGTYIPGPKKAYVLDRQITQAYCAPITGTDPITGNPIYGIATGSVTFNFTSYTPYTGNFTYEITDLAGAIIVPPATGTPVDMTVANLVAGKYRLVLKLSPTGCEVTSDFQIVSPAVPLNLGYNLNAITCDTDKANMTINTTGGGIPYKYTVTKAGGISVYDGYDNYLQGLEDDTYDITVTDIYGCSVSKTLSITKPSPIVATVTPVDNICNGKEGGTITVNTPIVGGIQNNSNYWYILEYPSGLQTSALTTPIFTGLGAGKYKVYVVGDGGCKSVALDAELIDPAKGDITTQLLSGVGCDAAHSKAKVKVKASSVAGGPYDIYMLDGSGAVVNTVTSTTGEEEFDLVPNVSGQSYTFYAEDANGCFTNIKKYAVANIEDLAATIALVKGKVSCFGYTDGIITVQATGGVGIRNYTLLKGGVPVVHNVAHNPESNQFTDLGVGTYTVKVTTVPDLGCEAQTLPFDITGPKKLELDIIKVVSQKCVGVNEGEIYVKGKGGYVNADGSGYKYTISSDAPGRVRNNGDFKNLEPGDYTITLFDINGRCPVSSGVITIEPANAVIGLVVQPSIIQKVCSSDAEPSFDVELSGGEGSYWVDINSSGNFTEIPNVPVLSTNPNTPGAMVTRVSFGTVQGIEVGKTYLIRAKDSRNCKAVPVDMAVVFAKTIDLGLQINPIVYDCNTPGKSLITASVNNAYVGEVEFVLWAVDPSGGLDIDMETNETGKFVNMPTGEYYVTVKQKLPGTCMETSSKFDLNNITDNLEFTVDSSQMNTLIVNAVGGLEPYEYSYDGGITFTSNNTFRYSEAADYDVIVKDARGCLTSDNITGNFESIIIPNYFTPDGDSINDFWYPRNVRTYHNLNVTIFDRYSREIKDFKGANKGWDGRYKGNPLPRGDYWYRVRYTELTGSIVDKVGHFTLYRKD